MKTKAEFEELYLKDEAFAREIADLIKEKKQNGVKNVFEAVSEIAKEKGFEITAEDVSEFSLKNDLELTDELVSEVSGGGNCGPGVGDGWTPPDKDMSGKVQETGCGK